MKEESSSAGEYDRLRRKRRKKSHLTTLEWELLILRVDQELNDFLGSGSHGKWKLTKKIKDGSKIPEDWSTRL